MHQNFDKRSHLSDIYFLLIGCNAPCSQSRLEPNNFLTKQSKQGTPTNRQDFDLNSDNTLYAPNGPCLIVIHDYVSNEHSRNGQDREKFRITNTGLVFHIGAPVSTEAYDDNMHFFLDSTETSSRALPRTAWQLYVESKKNGTSFHATATQAIRRILQALLEQGIRGFDYADLFSLLNKASHKHEKIIVSLESWDNQALLTERFSNESVKSAWIALFVEEKDALIETFDLADKLLDSFAKDREADLITCNPQKTLGAYVMLLSVIEHK